MENIFLTSALGQEQLCSNLLCSALLYFVSRLLTQELSSGLLMIELGHRELGFQTKFKQTGKPKKSVLFNFKTRLGCSNRLRLVL
jgi:hypothetical protein